MGQVIGGTFRLKDEQGNLYPTSAEGDFEYGTGSPTTEVTLSSSGVGLGFTQKYEEAPFISGTIHHIDGLDLNLVTGEYGKKSLTLYLEMPQATFILENARFQPSFTGSTSGSIDVKYVGLKGYLT